MWTIRSSFALASWLQTHELRGYGAVHLAALERVAGKQTVLASGDRDLCTAAAALGFAVANTSRTDR